METTDRVYLYGASGHAKVVMDIARLNNVDVPCLIDDNELIDSLVEKPVVHSAAGLSPMIVTIGDCRIRRTVVQKLGEASFLSLLHPTSIIADSVKIGKGTVVMAGTIINPYTMIGSHCIINTGASIDHDSIIHDFVHIAPHCTLCGQVEIEECTWVGAGTTILQGIHIGKDCFIGAGAVVVRDIPDGCLCYGNPCRIKKSIYSPDIILNEQ